MNQKTRRNRQRRNTIRRRNNNKRRQRKTRVKGGDGNNNGASLLEHNSLRQNHINRHRSPMTPRERKMIHNAMKFEAKEQKRIEKLQLLKQQIEKQLAQPSAYFEAFSSGKNVEPLNNPYLHSNAIFPEKQKTESTEPYNIQFDPYNIQFDSYQASSQTQPLETRQPLQQLPKDELNAQRRRHIISSDMDMIF